MLKKKDEIKFLSQSKFLINEDKDSESRVEIINIDSIELADQDKENEIIIDSPDIELLHLLKNAYENTPDLKTFTIKNNVTNILKEESDYENLNNQPKDLSVSDKVFKKDYLKIGTAYHTVMQYLQFTETKEDIINLINSLISKNYISKDIAKDISIDEIYLAKENLKELILNATKIYKEKQFVMNENYNKLIKNSDNKTKVIIQGIIDLVVITDQGAFLIDYKTNRNCTEEQLISDYKLQLMIYKMAFEKATNINIDKMFLYSFSIKKLIEIK